MRELKYISLVINQLQYQLTTSFVIIETINIILITRDSGKKHAICRQKHINTTLLMWVGGVFSLSGGFIDLKRDKWKYQNVVI